MSNLEINDKRLYLLKRSNILLEKTKKNYKRYQPERKLLLSLSTDNSIDYETWEIILDALEILIKKDEEK